MKINIRLIYLYLVTFIGLVFAVIGCIRLTELALKVYVFKGADEYSRPIDPVSMDSQGKINEDMYRKQIMEELRRQRQREIAGSLSMIVVGTPLYLYHWKTIQKENKTKK